jgi:ABC-type transport system substrate-binding protein
LFGLALLIVLLMLVILAWSVRRWQQDMTTGTSEPVATVTEPVRQSMSDQEALSVLPPAAVARGGHLAVGVPEPVERLNPLYTAGIAENDAVSLLFESLATFDAEGQLLLELAESVAYDEDANTVRFVLREDHTFRNGRPVQARDVVLTYQIALSDSYDGQLRGQLDGIEHVEASADDPRQVVFRLSDTILEPDYAWFTVGILNSDAYAVDLAAAYKLGITTPPPEGSGPYEWTSSTDRETILTLREGFDGSLQTITFLTVDSADQLDSLQQGTVDLMYSHWDARLKLRLGSLSAFDFMVFDRPSAFLMINRGQGNTRLDTAAAQTAVLLAAAGEPLGETDRAALANLKGQTLLCPYYRGFDEFDHEKNRQSAEQSVSALRQLGLTIELTAEDWPDLASRTLEGRYDLLVLPTMADERLPPEAHLLRPGTRQLAESLANTTIAAFQSEALLFSRRLQQLTLNANARPLSVHPFSWTDQLNAIRILNEEDLA